MKKFISKLKAFFKEFQRKMNGCELCGNEDYHVEICTEGGIRLCNNCDPQPKTKHEILVDLLNTQYSMLEAIDEKIKPKSSTERVMDALKDLKEATKRWELKQKAKALEELHLLEEKFDDLVDEWHSVKDQQQPIHEFFGLTQKEYFVIVAIEEGYEELLKKAVQNKAFKLGLDLHGVIDTYPEKFVKLAKSITVSGGEVIICTGSADNEKLHKQLLSYNNGIIWWTSIFSITDYLKSKNIPHTESADGGIQVENVLWDQAKGDWAREFNIDLHIDDSPEYGKYFDKGVYLKFNKRERR